MSPAMSPATSISYLVLAHEDPSHLRALLTRLGATSVRFYVHVDAKTDILAFRRAAMGAPNVHFCEPRVAVTWAAFSVVEATLMLIESALNHGDGCSRLVLLSGTDYPLAANVEISNFFDRHPRRQFIRRFPILQSDDAQRWKVLGRHFRELAPRHSWSRLPLFALERTLRLLPRRLPRGWPPMCGSQWWALTPDCARYCLEFSRARPDVLRFFRTVFAPDEIFFHTVVHNSPFGGDAGPAEPFSDLVTKSGSLAHYANLHYLPGTIIATSDDAHAALRSRPDKLFARKFSSRLSSDAIRVIDRHLDGVGLGRRNPIETAALPRDGRGG
jgi:Core-2/I-Branching enzyme